MAAAAPEPLVRCSDVARTYGKGTGAVVAVHGVSCAAHPCGDSSR
ncbi:hypothetical protein ACFPK5_36055 [Streptomyces beijiangensis]